MGMKPMTAVLIGTALSVVGVMCAAASAGIARQQLTIYGKATQVQSIDHSDDRARGVDHNPFNADTKLIVPRMKHKEKGKGTLPGDNALYSFKLYRDSSLQKSVGSAVYSCTFNFAHHAL